MPKGVQAPSPHFDSLCSLSVNTTRLSEMKYPMLVEGLSSHLREPLLNNPPIQILEECVNVFAFACGAVVE